MTPPHNLYDFDFAQLTDLLAAWGFSPYYARLLWRALYRDRVTSVGVISGLRADLMQRLVDETVLYRPSIAAHQTSSDGTHKLLLRLDDGQLIETVLMPYRDRYTVCISSQAGCAMGCVFCATGQMGFARHLTAGEMVAQVLLAQELGNDLATPQELRNVVFMGMGEPLHNYDATMRAVSILADDSGLGLGQRHLTVSTVGLPPAIRRLAAEAQPVNLAVSLHGATDAARNSLIPVARRWPLSELLSACRYYASVAGRRIFFEWTLIKGENDTPQQAHALSRLLEDIDAHVNLIPLNPTRDYDGGASSSPVVSRFQMILSEHGIPSTVRQRRGLDIDAGCGQLRQRVTS